MVDLGEEMSRLLAGKQLNPSQEQRGRADYEIKLRDLLGLCSQEVVQSFS